MDSFWTAQIRDLLEHMSPDEAKNALYTSLGRDNPKLNEIMRLVDKEITIASIKGLAKTVRRAQSFDYVGFGGDQMQSNFATPNSEGEVGPGTSVGTDGIQGPGGSYMQRALILKERARRKREEEKKRREKRLAMLDRLAADENPNPVPPTPGGKIKRGPGAVRPGDTMRDVEDTIEDVRKEVTDDTDAVSREVDETEQDTDTSTENMTDKTKKVKDKSKEMGDTVKQISDETEENADKIEESTDRANEAAEGLEDTINRMI